MKEINKIIYCMHCLKINSFVQSYLGSNDKLNPLFENRNGGEISAASLFLDSGTTNGHSTSRVPESLNEPLSGLSSDFRGTDGSTVASQLGSSKMIGENLIRSQSAAPSLDGRLSVGPPPGLENRETPVVSNLAPRDSYLESDRSHLQQLGQRRSASTGVIGESSPSPALQALGLTSFDDSTSGAVRPAAKTLMDLIQEDFPPESPDVMYQNDYPGGNVYFDRPRTASPLSPQNQDQLYKSQDDFMRRNGGDGLTESLDRFRISQRQTYGSMVSVVAGWNNFKCTPYKLLNNRHSIFKKKILRNRLLEKDRNILQ